MKPERELGKKAKAAREAAGLSQIELGIKLKVANSAISKFEHEGKGSRKTIEKLCNFLNIDIDIEDYDIDKPLRVGFTLSHWPAPLVWINEQLGGRDFFKKVNFACSSDESGKPKFNEPGEKLQGFDPEIDPFFFSGEIKRLVIEDELDIGLLGSDVLNDEPDLVKVARIMCATKVRHHIAVVIPTGLSPDDDQLMEIMTNEGNPDIPSCMLFYHPNSTAQSEFSKLFLRSINAHDTLSVSPISTFRENFKAKVLEATHTIYAYVGIQLTAEAVAQAVKELNSTLPEPAYRCKIVLSNEIAAYIEHKFPNSGPKLPPLYYDIITQRNNKRIRELVSSAGFAMFFTKLWEAVRVLNQEENKSHMNSLPNIKVAEFFKMNKKATGKLLQQTDFELVFYPDWVKKAILLKP